MQRKAFLKCACAHEPEGGSKMAKKCGREFAGNLHHHGIAWRSGCIDAFVGSIIVHKDGFVKLGGC